MSLSVLSSSITAICIDIVTAVIVYIIGKWAIGKIMGFVEKMDIVVKNNDPTITSFIKNLIKTLLYIVLAIAIISILGIPTASVITILASAGVAVGMSMQGSLSNLAGGIMLLIFRSFKNGDYISAGGAEGTVKEINLFYTVLTTVDNKVITIPNGNLMSANVTNFSAMPTRRVDFTYRVGRNADIETVKNVLLETAKQDDRVLADPAPFATLSGVTDEAREFTLRVWVESANYWDVYFQLNTKVTEALSGADVGAPTISIQTK